MIMIHRCVSTYSIVLAKDKLEDMDLVLILAYVKTLFTENRASYLKIINC